MSKRLIIGISGASGAPLAVSVLKQLNERHPDIEAHLIVSRGGAMTLQHECGIAPAELTRYAASVYDNSEIGAAPASGSFQTIGMLVVPCSMKSVAGIVTGYSDNLLLRAADVTLKERRKLVLCTRESPLSIIHLRNLYEAGKAGAIIMPPVPAWYRHPKSMADCTDHIAARLLSQFVEDDSVCEWTGL